MILLNCCSLSLPYAVVLLLLQICMKHFNDFAIIDIPSLDHQTCAANMWRNLFYVDQFYPLDERVSVSSIHWKCWEHFFFHLEYSFFSVHDMVVDSIAWNAILRRCLYHFVDIEKSPALRHRNILLVFDRLIFGDDRTTFSRSSSAAIKIEFKVNWLQLFRIPSIHCKSLHAPPKTKTARNANRISHAMRTESSGGQFTSFSFCCAVSKWIY